MSGESDQKQICEKSRKHQLELSQDSEMTFMTKISDHIRCHFSSYSGVLLARQSQK
jgi:hypothetical protein